MYDPALRRFLWTIASTITVAAVPPWMAMSGDLLVNVSTTRDLDAHR